MSLSNQHPDLEDSTQATAADGGVADEAAACAREKRSVEPGSEPISLWVLAACGVVVLIAGGILDLGGAGKFFDYQSLVRPRYVRTPAPGTADQGPPPKEALAAYMARGAKVYGAKCVVCHGPEAKGDGANYPSLAGSKWATGETERFAMIVLNGLQGPTSTGKAFPGAGMPTQAPGLSPEDIAGVLTYVRNHFGNATGDVVTVAMVKEAIKISAARAKAGQQVTAEELAADHLKALPGPTLDPKAMVDPITLAPVRAAK